MDNIVIQMIILLLLVVAGFVSNRCGLMGGDFDRKLSGFIINVSCPCLIISSVMGDAFSRPGHDIAIARRRHDYLCTAGF